MTEIKRGDPLDALEIGQEYKIANGTVFCIVEVKGKKYRAIGNYEECINLKATEQKARLLPTHENTAFISIPYMLI